MCYDLFDDSDIGTEKNRFKLIIVSQLALFKPISRILF